MKPVFFCLVLLFALVLLACGSPQTTPLGHTATTDYPPPRPAPVTSEPTLMAAGPSEYGSAYTMDHPGQAVLRLSNEYVKPGETLLRTLADCDLSQPIRWARTDELVLPNTWNESPSGATIPAGQRYLHVRLDEGTCLAATRQTTPVGPGEYWIDGATGSVTPMAQGGNSPHCQGSTCTWYTTVNR